MSNEGGREQRKDPASVFDQKPEPEPEVCRGRLEGLWPIDLGEHVVGSAHDIEVPAPRNQSGQSAATDVGVKGSPALSVLWPNRGYEAGKKQAGPLIFRFEPKSAGVHQATMQFHVQWNDGQVEVHEIRVTARARAVNAAPESGGRHKSPKSTPKAPGAKAPDRLATENSKSARDELTSAHDRLMREQAQGIDDVSREAAKFKPPPAPRSIWELLADLAITIGTGQLAGIVSRFVSNRVASVLVNATAAEGAAKAVDSEIELADNRARDAAEGPIVPTSTRTAEADIAKQSRAIENMTSDTLGDAVHGILTTAASKITTQSDTLEEERAEEGAPSKDKEIAFFSSQKSMHNTLSEDAKVGLIQLGGELIKTDPDNGSAIVSSMAEGIRAAASGKAKKAQADATSAEFATYLARTKLGTETVKTAQGEETVTNLEKQRTFDKHDKLSTPELAAGVLEIQVSRDAKSGGVSVTGAKMNGVSWLTADRLKTLDLRTTGVLVRISVHHGATIITVDEANRVRVGGAPLDIDGPVSEAQDIREAERIVQQALSKTLSAWGVDIMTNDQGQPRGKKQGSDHSR